MKRLILLLLISFIGLSAKSQQTYDYRTEREVYNSEDLTLHCKPNIYKGVFDGVFLYPKTKYDHYREISKDWPKFGGSGAPILNDPVALFQGALNYTFTPKQRAAFDSTQYISINVCWDKETNIYMLSLYFRPSVTMLSIAPEHYAKLYRYLMENIRINPRWKPSEEYDWGYLRMDLTPEAIKADQAYHERTMRKYQESLRK